MEAGDVLTCVRVRVRVFGVTLLVSHVMGRIRIDMSENRMLRRTFGPKCGSKRRMVKITLQNALLFVLFEKSGDANV